MINVPSSKLLKNLQNPVETPFYHLVPKEYEANLRFRREILDYAYKSKKNMEEIWIMCARDVLFYINTFGYTYDPRIITGSNILPMITYPEYQDGTVIEIITAIRDGYDLLIEKSRTMGITWLLCFSYKWIFNFDRFKALRLVSRDADMVDKTDDPNSLFHKVDFIHKFEPAFLKDLNQGLRDRTKMHFINRPRSNVIDGDATTSDLSVGGRCTSMGLDEFALCKDGEMVLAGTQHVTRSRIFISTHRGTNNAFYHLIKNTNIRVISLHWTLHPEYKKGLYVAEDGVVNILDKDYDFGTDYQFIFDGKVRSPWYDNECDRAPHPMIIRQELDMDPFASDSQFFDPKLIQDIEEKDVREPLYRGTINYDRAGNFKGFVKTDRGMCRLWYNLIENDKLPEDYEIIIGADIAAGTGASNSVVVAGNMTTREKIFQYDSPNILPEDFAKMVKALATWFNNAFVIFDAGGTTGQMFSNALLELGYKNVYWRSMEGYTTSKELQAGCFMQGRGENSAKAKLFSAYRLALKEGTFIQRDSLSNQECLQYIYTQSRSIEHADSANNIDPSGARSNHGDRVTADVLLNKGYELLDKQNFEENNIVVPANCYYSMVQQRKLRDSEHEWIEG